MANIVELVVFPPMLRRDPPPGNRSYHEFESIISSTIFVPACVIFTSICSPDTIWDCPNPHASCVNDVQADAPLVN